MSQIKGPKGLRDQIHMPVSGKSSSNATPGVQILRIQISAAKSAFKNNMSANTLTESKMIIVCSEKAADFPNEGK